MKTPSLGSTVRFALALGYFALSSAACAVAGAPDPAQPAEEESAAVEIPSHARQSQTEDEWRARVEADTEAEMRQYKRELCRNAVAQGGEAVMWAVCLD